MANDYVMAVVDSLSGASMLRRHGSGSTPSKDVCAPTSCSAMLSVTLLGRFGAEFGAEPIPLHDGSKPQELFVYLLLKRQQAHTREEIASVLWEDSTSMRSKANLRKALWQLRAALKPPAGTSQTAPLLEVDGEWLRVHPDTEIWLDVAVLENAYTKLRDIDGASLEKNTAVELSDAVALYTGDLLPNRYQSWCIEERERLKHLYLGMLEKLLEFSEVQGEYEAGLHYGRSILAHDSTREHIHRQMMRLHWLRGDRGSALRQYEECVEVLATDLDVPPMRETTKLSECIRDGDGDAPLPIDPADAAAGSLEEIVDHLDHLQVVLGELRQSVQHIVRSTRSRTG
jgi:DNA-binding SARP family transcriptional activator